MTTGEELKTTLGLEKLKYVSFVRIINSPHRILVIFYDSRRPTVPLSTSRVLRFSNQFSSRTDPFKHSGPLTPLLPIEFFNGELRTAIVLTFDLSGTFGDKNNQVNESKILSKQKLNEWLTLADLATNDATSAFTKRTRKQRNRAVKAENRTAKIKECILEEDGSVLFQFETTATLPIYAKDYAFQKANPNNNFALEPNDEKIYHIEIKILDFMKWLKETRPDYLETKKISWKEMRDVLEVAYIQVYSDSPSFHWQGINYWISQLDGSLYPTDIVPKVWNRRDLHGNDGAFLDKHLAGLIKGFKFWYNPMASMILKRMKEQDLL